MLIKETPKKVGKSKISGMRDENVSATIMPKWSVTKSSLVVGWGRLVHDDLDDEVLLDLGVLQTCLVREELA